MQILTALLAGLVFGVGLIVSGMTNPAKVTGFLDLAGTWDPSLAFVMAGAVVVGAVGFRIAGRRERALLGGPMRLPATTGIDRRLVLGSLAFGAGWGLAGYCPGPALASLASGAVEPRIFTLAMLAGMALFELHARWPGARARSGLEPHPVQLFDTESSTFTYLLVAPGAKEAVIIDPVDRHCERDLGHLERLGLSLAYVLETHAHADHITSAGRLRALTGARAATPAGCGVAPAEIQLRDGDVIRFGGGEEIRVLHTPGHTAGSMSYVWRGHVFTGDTLLIDGCGRTDFQGGSSDALYTSVHTKLFTLPDATRVWPGHDYKGQLVSTIGWEKQHNARLAQRSRAEFRTLMDELHLPEPRLIDVAVPANRNLGLPHGV